MTGQYAELAERHLRVGAKSGNEWMVFCPWHDNTDSPAMQFNVDKGLFICFGCGVRGNIAALQKQLGIKWNVQDGDINTVRSKLEALGTPKRVQRVLPEDALKRWHFPATWALDRGFKKSTIEAFDLGYDPLDNYGTIPVRNIEGELVGVIKRFMDPDIFPRYKYPKHFRRTANIFASWMVAEDERDHVVICEGSLDAMKVWQAGYPAIAVFGSSINPSQIRVLRSLGIGRVTLFFDNDKAGRKTTQQALGWTQHLRDNKIVKEYRKDTDLRRDFIVDIARYCGSGTDPAALTDAQIRRGIASASPAR